jgi:hypothetical protein
MQLTLTLFFVVLLAYFFAMVEIQIEGDAGWGAGLPTWRIEQHWLLDLLWGGRAMTGYHAWVFPFITLMFHFPLVLLDQWSWLLEAKVIACIIVFWIAEDYMWFVFNPAFGWRRFSPVHATWHKHWVAGAPIEYWLFSVLAAILLRLAA